jgi:Icc-related predicted phosphoesterase
MKILASADIHGQWAVYDWLLKVARDNKVEAIVLAGDLLGCPDGFDTPEAAQRYESGALTELLASAAIAVFYIMGNDDLVELNSDYDMVKSIHNRREDFGRLSLVGYQYSLPFMGGTFEKPEPVIEADMTTLAPLLKPETVFVSHSPAFGILDPGFGEAKIGSRSIRELLESSPFLLHIHGHSHAGFGRNGRHFNVAAAYRHRAMILDLETMEHKIVVARSGGSEK